MTALSVLALLVSLLGLATATRMAARTRALARELREAHHERDLSARALAAVVYRAQTFLSCDDCGATLDVRRGAGVSVTEQGPVTLYCGECNLRHHPEDADAH